MGPWADSISATPAMTALSLATSNGAGHRIVLVPTSGSGAISTITTCWPWSARIVAVAAPMPREPPVTRTKPSPVMAVALDGWIEQSARDQLPIGRDDMIGHGRDRATGIGIAPAEITARAHEDVDDGLEFLVAEIADRAGVARAS